MTPSFAIYEALGLLTPEQYRRFAAAPATGLRSRLRPEGDDRVDLRVRDLARYRQAESSSLGLRGTSDQKKFVGSIAYGQETQTYGGFVPDPPAVQQSLAFILGPPGSYPYERTDQSPDGLGRRAVPKATSRRPCSTRHGVTRAPRRSGFNAISPSPIGGLIEPTYSPEYVDAFEVGDKEPVARQPSAGELRPVPRRLP